MKVVTTFFLPLAALIATQTANAFSIKDHLAITDRAIVGLQKCGLMPNNWDMAWNETVRKADEREDTDFVRKISKYSHYYNPNKTLNMSRVDSSVTISESVEGIHQLLATPAGATNRVLEIYELVGRIVHHLQDMAVPAHVVPVTHLSTDGFELFDVLAMYIEPFSPSECPCLNAAEPMVLLKQTALNTLAALEQPVTFQISGSEPETTTWSKFFWIQSENSDFGHYGPLGDVFGRATDTQKDGRVFSADPAQYARFKRAQVNAAVFATQAAILWANKQLSP